MPLMNSSSELSPSSSPEVLAVDLDGTLVATDTLHEMSLQILRQRPSALVRMPFWLLKGRAYLKEKIAETVSLKVETLPYHQELLSWLREQKKLGRKLVLCTAAHEKVAQSVADHLGIFDRVVATRNGVNNSSSTKAKALTEAFGHKAFDYVGNSSADLAVWAASHQAVPVNASEGVLKKVREQGRFEVSFPRKRVQLKTWAKVLRVHHYLKNILIFVPLLTAQQLFAPQHYLAVMAAFAAFCLCASGVYVSNDLLDLMNDREHPRKRFRPFAQGDVPLWQGIALLPFLFVSSFVLASVVSPWFTAWLGVYLAATVAYSTWLKRLVLVDCLVLAGLYTLRIVAGAAAIGVALSFWLLAFSIFVFLSLAFLKRYVELLSLQSTGKIEAIGRGYKTADLPVIQSLGVSAGYASVLVYALYIHNEAVVRLYARPDFLWLGVPLLIYFVSWLWLKANRGEVLDDPVVFALKDRTSLCLGVVLLVAFVVASV